MRISQLKEHIKSFHDDMDIFIAKGKTIFWLKEIQDFNGNAVIIPNHRTTEILWNKFINWDIVRLSESYDIYKTNDIEKWKYDWVFTIVWEQVEIFQKKHIHFHKNLSHWRCYWTNHYYIQDWNWYIMPHLIDGKNLRKLNENEINNLP